MDIKGIRHRIQTEFIPSRNVISAREAKEIVKAVQEGGLDSSALDSIRKEFESKFSAAGLREFDKAAAKLAGPSFSGADAIVGRLQVASTSGVKVTRPDAKTTRVEISFEAAARLARTGDSWQMPYEDGNEFMREVWKDKGLRIALCDIGLDKVPTDPSLPRFTTLLTGDVGSSHYYHREGGGWSSMGEDSAQILDAGKNVFHFHKDNNAGRDDEPLFTLEIVLDKTNDWHYPRRPDTSAESKAFKKGWNRFWEPMTESAGGNGFTLEATPRKKLDMKTPDEMRRLKGPAELIKLWEENIGDKLESLRFFDQQYTFAFDPKTKSYAMAEYTYGEADHRLYVFNDKGEFAGFYRVQDDGTRDWLEAFPGELGKPAAADADG